MYYKSKIAVEVPESTGQGKIHINSKGYVYWATEWKWDPVKRVTTDNRVSIGKILKEDNTKMVPNKRYKDFFGSPDPEADELRKHYDDAFRKEAGKINRMISFGPYAAIYEACRKCGCLDALQRAFPKDSDLIMGMVVHAIAAQNPTAQAFSGWCFDNYCGLGRPAGDSEISRLYQTLAKHPGDIQVFFELFRKNFESAFPVKGTRAVAFDSTNQGTYSKNIGLANPGHNKEPEKIPVVSTAMFVDETTGIPLWYEHYDGSLLDKCQTKHSLAKIADMGYTKIMFMFDRGYYSEEMHAELHKLSDIEYGLLCPEGLNWTEPVLDQYGPEIKYRQRYYVPDEDVYGMRIPMEVNGIASHAYLFFDPGRSEEEQATIHEVIEYYMSLASKRVRYSEKMADYHAPKGIIVVPLKEKDAVTGKNFILLEDTELIQKELDRTGMFIMLSETELTPNQAIRIVRRRDVAEKAFQDAKSHFDLKKTYTHTTKTYVGKMFMGFIANITMSSFKWFEKGLLNARSSETIATVMSELNKYKIEQMKDGNWRPSYAMNRKQKDIFEKLELAEADVIEKIRQLALRV